ncbi:Na+/H+ antiporter subunit E [Reinekea blandensis]|uniref:Multisubunit Na+/H+ antiporter, MnhE subunit n=1 Tax=Reinekea blandensis MED297 TaxID=314283 RepID=A4B984_9GAMM|nr:Na+/H+ antiporter subunit E [Reinekea blandensis]EAR11185.1 Multisubunit Na+/H+ antiporter, MnhE subunit [Reinekea sp. MED297] [Reinekea blandensis MED297]
MDIKHSLWPSPFNFALLLVVWILLTNSFSVGNLLLAVVLAWFIPFLVSRIQSDTSRVKKPGKAVRYVMVLLYDIIVSNIVVARQILGSAHKLQPGFIEIPLDLREPLPITLLASTISLTPGTVSTEVSKDRQCLFVHALNVPDEAALIAQIKSRYEAPLKEIFGC